MKKTINYLNCTLLIAVAGLIISCIGNSNRGEKTLHDSLGIVRKDSVGNSKPNDSYTGIFEYSDPDEDGYLYYKMELIQQGDSIHGKLYAANYLSSSAGGFSNPNAMMECDLLGNWDEQEGEHYISLMLTTTKEELLEEGAPSLSDKMNFPDSEEEVNVTFWKLWFNKGVLSSSNGQRSADGEMKVLAWENLHRQ